MFFFSHLGSLHVLHVSSEISPCSPCFCWVLRSISIFMFFFGLLASLHVLQMFNYFAPYPPCVYEILSMFSILLRVLFMLFLSLLCFFHVILVSLSTFAIFLLVSLHVPCVSARFQPRNQSVCSVLFMFSKVLLGFIPCSPCVLHSDILSSGFTPCCFLFSIRQPLKKWTRTHETLMVFHHVLHLSNGFSMFSLWEQEKSLQVHKVSDVFTLFFLCSCVCCVLSMFLLKSVNVPVSVVFPSCFPSTCQFFFPCCPFV